MKQAGAEAHFAAQAIVASGARPSRAYDAGAKRAFDMMLALILAPIMAPVIAILAMAVRAGGPGAPIFGHRRIGRDGRSFRCWKIRTMVPDADIRLRRHLERDAEAAAEWAASRKLTVDPRVTRLGDLLRRSSLDELPQIWNVLRGEMSFVGPRPVPADELELYGAASSAYCSLRPGITGLWQVSGRNEVSYAERIDLDLDYLARMSFALDLALIARTALVVVRPTGR